MAKRARVWKGSDYYREGGIEVLDVMRAKLTEEQLKGFYLGNIVKYSLRFNFIEELKERKKDLEKLKHYCELLIEEMERS